MSGSVQETDYLVIGGGAMSAAFVDALLDADKKATVTIIERRDRLGGHWCDAYPFVTLHQPAIFYGVNSIQLGRGGNDLSNKGEILEYYDKVLSRFLATGRVTFLGGHEYKGDHCALALDDEGQEISFNVRKRLVNGTYMGVEIPSVHPPKFEVDDQVPFFPLNDLPEQSGKWGHYYVLGCGKTGMDAVMYLLERGVPADNVHWVMSNDVWAIDRADIHVGQLGESVLEQCRSVVAAKEPQDVFTLLEKEGGIIRVDEDFTPTKWKCPTITMDEAKLMRRVENRIRHGRVKRLSEQGIEFLDGTMLSCPEKSVFINCTADALAAKSASPVFSDKRIDLQSILFCQQVFSAAAIAALEASPITDGMRNWIKPVPHPQTPNEWPKLLSTSIDNLLKAHAFIPFWLMKAPLFFLSHEPKHYYLTYAIRTFFASFRLRGAAKRLC